MRLLSFALAAQEWGWRQGTRLWDYEADEQLRELVAYIAKHHSAERKWVAVPKFSYVYYREYGTDDVFEVRMRGEADREVMRYQHDAARYFERVSWTALPLERVSIQCMRMVKVDFLAHSTIIYYRVDDESKCGF